MRASGDRLDPRALREEIGADMADGAFAPALDSLARHAKEVGEDPGGAFLGSLAIALKTCATSRSVEAAFVQLLPPVLSFSGSAFGFLAEVEFGAAGAPYFQSHAVTDVYKPGFGPHDIVSRLQFHNLQTLNGAVLTSREPVLSNDPANDPRAGGLPFGHAPLRSYLGLPFVVDGDLVGGVALANCPQGYSEADIDRLAPLTEVAGRIIAGYRLL